MSTTEKIYSLDPIVQKLVVDNLSLFRAQSFHTADKVLGITRAYLKKFSYLNFESAARAVNDDFKEEGK